MYTHSTKWTHKVIFSIFMHTYIPILRVRRMRRRRRALEFEKELLEKGHGQCWREEREEMMYACFNKNK